MNKNDWSNNRLKSYNVCPKPFRPEPDMDPERPELNTPPNDMNDDFVEELLTIAVQLQHLGAYNHEIISRLQTFKSQLQDEVENFK